MDTDTFAMIGHNVEEFLEWVEKRHGNSVRILCEKRLLSDSKSDPFQILDELLCKDVATPKKFAEIEYNG
jgi:hypothetical protein